MAEGTIRAYGLAKKYGIKTGWGTDILFNPKNTVTQGRQLAKLTRFYDPLTVLHQGTGLNGELLALSGDRNPYPGVLGRIAPAHGLTCSWSMATQMAIWTSWATPIPICGSS